MKSITLCTLTIFKYIKLQAWQTVCCRVLTELQVTQLVKKFPHLSRKQKVHYHVHRSPPLFRIMGQMIPVHKLIYYFFNIHLTIILSSMFRSLFQVFQPKFCVHLKIHFFYYTAIFTVVAKNKFVMFSINANYVGTFPIIFLINRTWKLHDLLKLGSIKLKLQNFSDCLFIEILS
jgi:hypothetical protein